MSGDARDFNNIETRAVIKFFFPLQCKAPKEIHAILRETLEEHAPSYATVKNWVAKFIRGDFSTCDAPRPGRTKTLTTPEIIDKIHELILEDCRISAKSIAQQLGISRERIGSIIHEVLDMRKFSAKWVPKCPMADQKRQRCQSSEQILEFFSARSEWFHVGRDWWPWTKPRCITITRRQSNNQWSGGIASHPTPKISEYKNPLENFSLRFFWDQDGILDYLSKGQTINAGHYLSLLVQLKDILKEKRRGRVTKGVLFLHDNSPAHRALATHKKLAYLGFQCLDHPPYSPDMGPSDYHLFPGLKIMKVHHFSSDTDFIPATENCWDNGQPSEFFLSGLSKLQQRAKKFIELCGEYVE